MSILGGSCCFVRPALLRFFPRFCCVKKFINIVIWRVAQMCTLRDWLQYREANSLARVGWDGEGGGAAVLGIILHIFCSKMSPHAPIIVHFIFQKILNCQTGIPWRSIKTPMVLLIKNSTHSVQLPEGVWYKCEVRIQLIYRYISEPIESVVGCLHKTCRIFQVFWKVNWGFFRWGRGGKVSWSWWF